MKVGTALLFCIVFLLVAPVADAAKPRVRNAKPAAGGTAPVGYSKARLSRSTNSVIITFQNLSAVTRVGYTLSYRANGIEQGAIGSIASSGAPTETRDLYFGTCSHGVCTPHRGIQNAVLLVETQLASGRTHVKRYRIRI